MSVTTTAAEITALPDPKLNVKIMKALAAPGEKMTSIMAGWKSLTPGDQDELRANARAFPEQLAG